MHDGSLFVSDFSGLEIGETDIPGMITVEERRYLTWLTTNHYAGHGAVVEIGPWLGCSTAHLAAGLNGQPIHCFDSFVWTESYAAKAETGLQPGDDFSALFAANMRRAGVEVVVTRGKMQSITWDKGPVELLVLDAPKSGINLMRVLAAFAPHLIPGRSRIIIRDYQYLPAYQLAVVMDALRQVVSLEHLVVSAGGTSPYMAGFRVHGEMPPIEPMFGLFEQANWNARSAQETWQRILRPLPAAVQARLKPGVALLLHDADLPGEAMMALAELPPQALQEARWARQIRGGRYPALVALTEARARLDPGNKEHRRTIAAVVKSFDKDAAAAQLAFLHFNEGDPAALACWDPDIIAQAVAFKAMDWPRRIRDHVRGCDVLDLACGSGLHGIGHLVVGARSYTGLDPALDLDREHGKNRAGRSKGQVFGWTGRQLMARMPRLRLVPGWLDALEPEPAFDLVVLHNAIEGMTDIEADIAGIAARLRPGGKLVFRHQNFFAWNGHRQAPRLVSDILPGDPGQESRLDWRHLLPAGAEPAPDRIRVDALRALLERRFDILDWTEVPSTPEQGAARLTPAIMARHPDLTERDFLTHTVFGTVRLRTAPGGATAAA